MNKILRRILGRLLTGLGVLWGAATLTFFMINLSAGDTAIAILGGSEALPTPAVLARVRAEYGLDKPLYVQYGDYLLRLVRGDLGDSFRLRIPVTEAIGGQIGATLTLAAVAGTLAIVIAVVVAILTARRGRRVRSFFSGVELALTSVPGFATGILLLLAFSFKLRWFPSSGSEGFKSMVLPSLTLALPIAAVLTQVLRQELEEILEQPFITMARARGMSDAGVRLRHALRHALIPLVTLSGFVFAGLFGGAVIAETLFARQGLGRLMFDSTSTKDIPVVIGVTLLIAFIYVLINFIVDVLYVFIDPRLRAA